ncbi:ulp1 protease family, C-terminal catalytic domain-containing protein [Tanacetum coccineum]
MTVETFYLGLVISCSITSIDSDLLPSSYESSDYVLGALKFSYICFKSGPFVSSLASLPLTCCMALKQSLGILLLIKVVTAPGISKVDVSSAIYMVRDGYNKWMSRGDYAEPYAISVNKKVFRQSDESYFAINATDIIELLTYQELECGIVTLFEMSLYHLKGHSSQNKVGFLNPGMITADSCFYEKWATIDYLTQSLTGYEFYLAPYLQGRHYVLFIICPKHGMGFILNSSKGSNTNEQCYRLAGLVESVVGSLKWEFPLVNRQPVESNSSRIRFSMHYEVVLYRGVMSVRWRTKSLTRSLAHGTAGYGGALNRVGNANPGQERQVKCYNCNGRQDNAVDEDVDEQPVQDLALNVDNVFQVDDCDAFDSDIDKAPTSQTMFMANLSSVDPVYDETGPSYDSDILFEVYDHDHYQDAVCEHHQNTISLKSITKLALLTSLAEYYGQ